MLTAIDLGAEDVIDRGDAFEILTPPEEYHNVHNGLEEAGYNFIKAEITYIPQNYTELTDEKDIVNMDKMIDALEDNDDVQEVYTNWLRPEDEDE